MTVKTESEMVTPSRVRSRKRANTRDALIRVGMALLTEKSFASTGIEDVLNKTGVPRGSFYHFFPSKEAFGEAVIDSYASYFNRKLDRLLLDTPLSPLDRLRAYVEEASHGMERFNFARGCLIGNLSQELGARSDAFRPKLEAVFQGWQRRVADCLRAAVRAGEASPSIDADALAEFFWYGWEGALTRAKLTQSVEPLRRFAQQFIAGLRRP